MMDNYNRVYLLWLSVGVFLLLLCAKADNPLGNVNLSPFWQWRSAWECMQNFSQACTSAKDTLKLNGILNVSHSEVGDYCRVGGCAEHTKYVLTCIFHVKRDFWFANGASVQNLTDTINNGCAKNSSMNTNFKSSAVRTYQNFYVLLLAYLGTTIVVNIFNM